MRDYYGHEMVTNDNVTHAVDDFTDPRRSQRRHCASASEG